MACISETVREQVVSVGRTMAQQVEAMDEEHLGTLDWGIIEENLRAVADGCVLAADKCNAIEKALA